MDRIKFFRFLVAAGASVPFNVGSRVIFSKFVPFEFALILSHCIGMTVAFVLTRTFVFHSTRKNHFSELSRFAIVNIVSVAQTWIVGVTMLRILFPLIGYHIFPELVAHVLGLATASITSFVGHRHFSFREDAPHTPK